MAMLREWRDAVIRGDITVVEQLLDAGIEINARDKYGQTALFLAALHDQTEMVRLLATKGANLNITAKGHFSALMIAIIRQQTEIARVLIHAGADLNIRGGKYAHGWYGKSALALAEECGQTEIVNLLKQAGATD